MGVEIPVVDADIAEGICQLERGGERRGTRCHVECDPHALILVVW